MKALRQTLRLISLLTVLFWSYSARAGSSVCDMCGGD